MSIGNYSRGKLEAIIKKVNKTEDSQVSVSAAGSDTQIQYNNGRELGGVSSLTYNDSTGHLLISDDKKLYFGSNSDAYIEYNEDGDNYLVISGSADGIVLSGSTVQIDGTLEGASPLKIAGGIEIVPASDGSTTEMLFGDNIKTYYGTDRDTYIQYNNSSNKYLEISGGIGGLVLSGSSIYMDSYMGVGVAPANITHAITLPNSDTNAGKMKASAYTTYSSARYKEDVKRIDNPLQTIKNLEGVTFSWKKTKTQDMGFIAEQVGQVLPNIVEWEADGVNAQSMDYTRIIPYLVESIKDQQKQIDILRDEISFLKK